ncbi:DUF6338 family protein [Actinomadura luteofluorescens]|uniref:DUF6338 family protein n=1 Tax=Actinomadura luteofluorescens TaxID=46163 RepID=UPI0036291AD9
MTVGSIVVPVVLLVLAAVPGLHFDLVRGRRERARPGGTLPRFSRVVVAGTMVTTVTSILLGVLGQAVVPSPHRLLDEGGAAVPPSPPPGRRAVSSRFPLRSRRWPRPFSRVWRIVRGRFPPRPVRRPGRAPITGTATSNSKSP